MPTPPSSSPSHLTDSSKQGRFPLSISSLCALILLIIAAFPLASWSNGWSHEEGFYYAFCFFIPALLLTCYLGRKRKVHFYLHTGRFFVILGLGWLYNVLANISHFAYPDLLVSNILMCAGVLAILWAILQKWAMIFWSLILFFGMLEIFIYSQYGSTLNSLIIAEILETSPDDAQAYINTTSILSTLGIIALLSLLVFIQFKIFRPIHRGALLFHGLLLCSIASLISTLPQQQDAGKWPLDETAQLIGATKEAVSHNIATLTEVERLDSPSAKASSMPLITGKEGIIVILHVGESLRADRMSLNGYSRKTTPELDELTRLINFSRCVAVASETSQAHICILTNARRTIEEPDMNMRASTGSVLDLFVKHGFKLTSFFGRKVTQQLKHDRVMKLLSSQSSKQYYNKGQFMESADHIKQHLRTIPSNENQIFFICNEGSHTPFNHYDKQNPPFTPTIDSFNDPKSQAIAINNAYDNTVHYTDRFISRVIQQLEGRPYLYLFISDHGEILGENGIWGRGALGDKQHLYLASPACHVGMFAISSPEFNSLHPHFEQSMSQLAKNKDMIVSHEHIFHTLLGIMKLETEYYIPELDLASEQAEAYTGAHPFSQPDASTPHP